MANSSARMKSLLKWISMSFVSKKLWTIILGGLVNCIIYTLYFVDSVYSLFGENYNGNFYYFYLLFLAFFVLLWCLCSSTIGNFFIKSLILLLIFVFIGFPLLHYVIHNKVNVFLPPGFGTRFLLGRVFMAYLEVSTLAWVVALIYTCVKLLIYKKQNQHTPPQELPGEYKKCPDCGADIKTEAIVCKHCWANL